jgi:ABC-type arginine/histidine transport system permease subunit
MSSAAFMAAIGRFQLVAATVAAGIVVTVLLGLGEELAARWTASTYAMVVAVVRSGSMLKALRRWP